MGVDRRSPQDAEGACPPVDFLESFAYGQSATLVPLGADDGRSVLTLFGVGERTMLYSHSCPQGDTASSSIRADAMQLRTRDFSSLFLSGDAGGPPNSILETDADDDDLVLDEGVEGARAGGDPSVVTAVLTATSAAGVDFSIRVRVLGSKYSPAGRDAGDFEAARLSLTVEPIGKDPAMPFNNSVFRRKLSAFKFSMCVRTPFPVPRAHRPPRGAERSGGSPGA